MSAGCDFSRRTYPERAAYAWPHSATPVNAAVQGIFPVIPTSRPRCRRAAKDTDPVWSNRQSWAWTERPAYGNAYMRLFRCQSRSRTLTSSR